MTADTLKASGLRATTPRVAIFDILEKASYPMGVQEVKKKLRAKRIDTATIYRTLETFKHARLVAHVDFQLGRALYELTEGKPDHHHIVCQKCNKIQDFTGCGYQPLAKQVLRQAKGFASITNHSLELFGLCVPCAGK